MAEGAPTTPDPELEDARRIVADDTDHSLMGTLRRNLKPIFRTSSGSRGELHNKARATLDARRPDDKDIPDIPQETTQSN